MNVGNTVTERSINITHLDNEEILIRVGKKKGERRKEVGKICPFPYLYYLGSKSFKADKSSIFKRKVNTMKDNTLTKLSAREGAK